MQINHIKTLTVADGTATSVVRPSDWNSLHYVNAVLSGNTAGSSQVSGLGVILNGGQNITLSADTANSQIIFSGGGGGITNQTGPNIAVPGTTITSGTVVFSNSNGVSFGINGATLTATVATNYQSQGAYLTTAALSQNSSLYAGTAGAITGGSITMNTSGVSINLPAYLTTAQSPGAYLTTAMLSNASTAFAGTNGAMTGGSLTINTSGVSISLPSYLTTAAQSGQTSNFAGTGTSFGGTNVSGSMTLNTTGLTLSLSGPSLTGFFSNTATSFGGTNISGSITFNTAGLSLSLSAGAGGAGDGVNIVQIGTTGTTGTSFSASTGTVFFNASNNITVSQNASNQIVISGPTLTTLGYVGTNTAQSNVTWTVNSSGLSLDARGYAGTATTVAAAGGIGASVTLNSAGLNISLSDSNSLSRFVPMDFFPALSASSSAGVATMHLYPFILPAPISFGQINMLGAIGTVTTAPGNTFTVSQSLASSLGFTYSAAHTATKFIDIFLFSRISGGGTTNLSMFASTENSMLSFNSFTMAFSGTGQAANSTASFSISQTHSYVMSMPGMTSQTITSINAASTITTWGTANMSYGTSASASTSNTGNTTSTYSSSIAATFASTTIFSGNHLVPFQFATSLTPGEYWLGMLPRSSTSSSSNSAINNNVAGNSLSFAINGSVFTTIGAQVYSSVGMTSTIASSLGWLGSATAATMAVQPGHGSFSATYTTNSTYVNNLAQGSGVIALSQINSNVSFWRPWFELASNRI